MMSFQDRSVVITGAAGHLGRAVVQHFAQAGARLVLLDRRAEALAQAFGTQHLQIATDLLDADDTRAAVQSAVRQHGRLDVLCHLAGGFHMGEPVHETPAGAWQQMLDINARSLLNVAHAVVPEMLARGGGRIVAVGAFAAQKGAAQMGAYVAAKAAVIRLVESMSAELREQGIGVNCVLPTIIDTPDNRRAMPEADPARWVAPAALAEVIGFLASDAARAVHGAALPVTGLS
jgi:NAD(P)-dependent dehydrogenase (short-subunit alcohol dehydrogenase family)